jgi:hypothetical protein
LLCLSFVSANLRMSHSDGGICRTIPASRAYRDYETAHLQDNYANSTIRTDLPHFLQLLHQQSPLSNAAFEP